MPSPAATAVLLDIDGTLADTNYLHVDAWSRAFEEAGHPVDAWRIHRHIGADSEVLLDALLGDEAERLSEQVKDAHREHYAASRARMRPLPGARELLQELARRGFRVVLATSAPPEEFAMLREVLDVEDPVTAVTIASDVEAAKPAPDVIGVALEKAGAAPEQAVMVGDAVWDAESAGRAGVRCIGVLSGGAADADLREAGAIAIYDDAAHLLRELDASPLYER